MVVKHVNKHGKANSTLMAQHISEPNHKCATTDDPYGAEEQLGKQAKPDVCSAATNTQAHAIKE